MTLHAAPKRKRRKTSRILNAIFGQFLAREFHRQTPPLGLILILAVPRENPPPPKTKN